MEVINDFIENRPIELDDSGEIRFYIDKHNNHYLTFDSPDIPEEFKIIQKPDSLIENYKQCFFSTYNSPVLRTSKSLLFPKIEYFSVKKGISSPKTDYTANLKIYKLTEQGFVMAKEYKLIARRGDINV